MGLLLRVRNRLAPLAIRLLPDSLFGRLALLLFVVVLASHALVLTVLFELHPAGEFAPPPGAPRYAVPGGIPEAARMVAGPATSPGPSETVAPAEQRLPPADGILFDIGVRLGALMFAAWIGARWLSQPVQRLADAARELGRDIHRPPLAEAGTAECRDATRVFNGMQARIQRQIADRDRFVAAVSHDLRTPLTRLRLRAESLSGAEDRDGFRRDVAEMDAMIRDTLDYLLGVAQAEPSVRFDIGALAHSIADDHADSGQPGTITVEGLALPIVGQPGALRRCLRNLIENALRYGGSAEIMLREMPGVLCVEIADRGPGLPSDELARVMEPFYRVEASRNRHSGGAGLGLSIAREIVQRHGGTLVLSNRAEGGLLAELQFPRTAA